jgi:type II secretory pathway pseudopilin PulG
MGPVAGREDGYTIVEIMIAMFILLIGVMGTLTLIQGSLASTSRTTAREQGTNLARDLVERARQAAYTDLTVTGAPAKLRATLPASDAASAISPTAPSSFTVKRRNVSYAVTVTACAVDDPTDGAGEGDAQFCVPPDAGSVSEPPPALPAASVRVLGLDVALRGSLLDTVCNAVGTNTDIAQALQAVLSPVAAVGICPAAAGGDVQIDSDPDDLRRVRVDVAWNRGGAGSVSQTTLLSNPSQN